MDTSAGIVVNGTAFCGNAGCEKLFLGLLAACLFVFVIWPMTLYYARKWIYRNVDVEPTDENIPRRRVQPYFLTDKDKRDIIDRISLLRRRVRRAIKKRTGV